MMRQEASPGTGSSGREKILVIIPTYNEAENIERICQEVVSSMNDVSILFVDDHSPDGTGNIADRLAGESPKISVIHRPKKMGLGAAYLDGFRYAAAKDYDYVLSMDCDLSHDPKDIPRLVSAARNGVDLVIGSRYIRGGGVIGWSFHRYLLSRLANFYTSAVLGFAVRDWTSGFKCYHRETLRSVIIGQPVANGYAFQIESVYRAIKAGFRFEEIPILFKERKYGKSKLGAPNIGEAFLRVLTLRLRR